MNEARRPMPNELRKTCAKRGWQLAPIDSKTWRIGEDSRDIRIGSLEEIAEFLADPIGVSGPTFRYVPPSSRL